MDEETVRSADLSSSGGAGALVEFISSVFDKEAAGQPFIEIETDDGVIIDKAELIFDGEFYRLRLSGL